MSNSTMNLTYFFNPDTLDVRVSDRYGDFEHKTKEWIFRVTSAGHLRFRPPIHISIEGWDSVPHDEFPKEFKTYLLMIGVSID